MSDTLRHFFVIYGTGREYRLTRQVEKEWSCHMDKLNICKETIRTKTKMNELFAEQTVEADITLPEYYQDIVRILKCNIYPVINSVSVTGERVTADGVAQIKIIYCGEEQKFFCYEMSYPFSKSIDLNGLTDDCKVMCETVIDNCNCRAVTNRRIDLRSMLKICFRAVRLGSCDAVGEVEGGGIELMKKSCSMLDCVNVCEKSFNVDEVCDLDENKPAVMRVLRTNANAIINETKVISNKVMLKGEALVNVLYISEDDSSGICSAFFSVLFNEIIEVPGVEEKNICELKVAVNYVDTAIKSRGSGECRALEFGIRMTADVSVYQVKQMSCCNDCFSTQFDIKAIKQPCDCIQAQENVDENYICRGNLDLSDISSEKIIDVSVISVIYNTYYEDGKAIIRGSVNLALLYMSSDMNVGYREKSLNLDYERVLREKGAKIMFDPSVSVLAVSYAMNAPGSMEVKVELIIKGSLFLLGNDNIISDIELLEDGAKSQGRSRVVLCYTGQGEKIWDIARRYNVSPQQIKLLNKLESDTVAEPCMLLVPCL